MIEVNAEVVLELQKRVEQMEAERETEKQAEAEQETPWVHVKVTAEKGQYQWVQHGIGRTEDEARKNAHIKGGYKVTSVEVIEPEIEPEKFELFHILPMYEEERKIRRANRRVGPNA